MVNIMEKNKSILKNKFFMACCLGLILIGLYHYINDGDVSKTILLLVKEIGMAILIAVALVIIFEKDNEKHRLVFMRHSLANLFAAVYQRRVQPSVFSEVEKSLLFRSVVTSDVDIDFSLENLTDSEKKELGGDYVKMVIVQSFTLTNATDSFIENEKIHFSINEPFNNDATGFSQITSLKVGNFNKLESSINSTTASVDIYLKANDSVRVEMKGYKFINKQHKELIVMDRPTENIDITIDNNLEIKHKLCTTGSNSLRVFKDIGSRITYKYAGGLIPGQVIILELSQ